MQIGGFHSLNLNVANTFQLNLPRAIENRIINYGNKKMCWKTDISINCFLASKIMLLIIVTFPAE